MAEYRAHLTPPAPIVTPSTQVEKWQTLDEQYGLTDMFDEGNTSTVMSIEEEWAAFVSAPLSPKGTPLLQFWEVCCIFVCSRCWTLMAVLVE